MDDDNTPNSKKGYKATPFQRQLLISLGPYFLKLIVGLGVSFGAVALPQLKHEDTTIKIDEEQASWIASLQFLVSCIACNFSGFLSAKYGRRKVLLVNCAPLILSWVVTSTSKNLEMLLIGCFLRGLANGTIVPILGVYIGEISNATNRGVLTAILQLFFESGLFLGHLLGTFLSWKTTSWVCTLVCCATTILIGAIPESPKWLLKEGKIVEAKSAFFKCDGISTEEKVEMGTLTESSSKNASTCEELVSVRFGKPFGILLVCTLTMLLSGYDVICAYPIYYLEELFGGAVNPYSAMLTMDILYILASLLVCLVSRVCKRRLLVLVNGFGGSLALLAMIAILEATKGAHQLEKIKTVALVVFLCAHTVFSEFGQSLHATVTSELFPSSTRSYGSSIIFTIRLCGAFILIKVGLMMLYHLGIAGVFGICAIVSLLGNLILLVILPETKDKTLEELEEYFR